MTDAAVVEVDDLDARLSPWRRLAAGAARRQLRHRPRRGLRPGRRIGLRQVDGRPISCSAIAPDQPASKAGASCSRATICFGLDRPALDRLRGNRIGLVPQNPTTALSPGMRVGRQVAEVLHCHVARPGARQRSAIARAVRPGRPARSATISAALSARALGRPAAARLHRHGACLRARSGRARRADDRSRRDDAGADRRPAGRPPGPARHVDALCHA